MKYSKDDNLSLIVLPTVYTNDLRRRLFLYIYKDNIICSYTWVPNGLRSRLRVWKRRLWFCFHPRPLVVFVSPPSPGSDSVLFPALFCFIFVYIQIFWGKRYWNVWEGVYILRNIPTLPLPRGDRCTSMYGSWYHLGKIVKMRGKRYND